ncbi:alpha/beta fold hydrolase [Catenovulum adriaticum]|uniref:Alpha/beta hydrolase n=1 Tax=Catenovulum adriaticum TaxID=2984846 RepID=A0ABY7AT97_9ALTE|nr:alpha/beta hydrolase [Catenovulum sp. TS8]WAJ71599.1 alpha/beta hydrolase [Catenovulum sp. TS8]
MRSDHSAKSVQAVLLLRGLIREQRHWMGFEKTLASSLPSRIPVVAMDIAGNGCEYKSKSSCSISKLRKELSERFSRQYSQYERIAIVALSMGGMIAVDWADAEPKRITNIVLINSSFKDLSPFYIRLRWQNYLKICSLIVESKVNKEKSILALTSNHKLTNYNESKLINTWYKIAEQYPISPFNGLMQLIAAARFRLPKKLIQVPILIIASRNDRLVDYRSSVALAHHFPQSSFILHPTAGHDLALDDPLWLSRQISAFIY